MKGWLLRKFATRKRRKGGSDAYLADTILGKDDLAGKGCLPISGAERILAGWLKLGRYRSLRRPGLTWPRLMTAGSVQRWTDPDRRRQMQFALCRFSFGRNISKPSEACFLLQ